MTARLHTASKNTTANSAKDSKTQCLRSAYRSHDIYCWYIFKEVRDSYSGICGASLDREGETRLKTSGSNPCLSSNEVK